MRAILCHAWGPVEFLRLGDAPAPVPGDAYDIEWVDIAEPDAGPGDAPVQTGERPMLASGPFVQTTRELETLVVGVFAGRPVYLRDVATATDGPEEPSTYTRISFGHGAKAEHPADAGAGTDYPAVTVGIARRKGSNAVRVAEDNPLYEGKVPYHFLRLLGDALYHRGRLDEAAAAYGRALEAKAELGHGDILFRASQLALGYEGDEPKLGTNFLLGYSVQLHADQVVLARHDYNETVVARSSIPFALGGTHHVEIGAIGSHFEVTVDGSLAIEADDPTPHLFGGVGLRASDSKIVAHRLDLRSADPELP